MTDQSKEQQLDQITNDGVVELTESELDQASGGLDPALALDPAMALDPAVALDPAIRPPTDRARLMKKAKAKGLMSAEMTTVGN